MHRAKLTLLEITPNNIFEDFKRMPSCFDCVQFRLENIFHKTTAISNVVI